MKNGDFGNSPKLTLQYSGPVQSDTIKGKANGYRYFPS